jgi:transposase
MKRTPRHNYKALYLDCEKQSAGKDALIALLQQQQLQWAGERKTFIAVIADQQQQLSVQQEEIAYQQEAVRLQLQTIAGQAEKIGQQQIIIGEQDNLIIKQQNELEQNKKALFKLATITHELRMLKRFVYGIKSEKRHQFTEQGKPTVGGQLVLSMEIDAWGVCSITGRRKIAEHLRVIKTTMPKKCGGRHDLPQGLEEQITVIDAPDKPANAKCIGYEDQRQLACDPIRWYVKIIRRPVYLAAVDKDQLNYKQFIAPLPAHPIPKCKVDVSILVMLLTDKYLYHLPVWRQQQRFRQYGIDLPYSTLCSLVNRTCEALEPLWNLLLKEVTVSGLINIDETTFRVLDNTKKKGKKSHIGWMWGTLNPMQGIVCFLYQQGRGKKDIRSVLQGYKGHLMTDAYGVYTQYGRQPGVSHQLCLSHARRYFMYALDNDAERAGYALDHFFGPLYGIEEACKLLQLDYDGITVKRQTESLPVLQIFREWLAAELPKTIARTPINKAIAYTLNNYTALIRYTADGMLPIDNNQLEGQIRSIALGRHNYLFAGSHHGGELAAILYSFMATCKLQKIDPAKWLDDVLRRIADQPENKLIELLPQFWKPLYKSLTAKSV